MTHHKKHQHPSISLSCFAGSMQYTKTRTMKTKVTTCNVGGAQAVVSVARVFVCVIIQLISLVMATSLHESKPNHLLFPKIDHCIGAEVVSSRRLFRASTFLFRNTNHIQRNNRRVINNCQFHALMQQKDLFQIGSQNGAKTYETIYFLQSAYSTRSTFNPDYEGGEDGNRFAIGREDRRNRLYSELTKLGIDPTEIETHPDLFGTAALRTYNSFLLPKNEGAWAVAESPTRARAVANSISFLMREYKADHEKWLRNVDKNRAEHGNGIDGAMRLNDHVSNTTSPERNSCKHPITIILDNVRSAHNVGNILRLAETSQVDTVRLCGMTPRPPHPKVLKTAMGSAEYVSLGADDDGTTNLSTLRTVLDLKAKGVLIFGVETTKNATSLWNAPIPSDENIPVAYIFGNELIGVDVDVLRECDSIISIPTYGIKNSLNIANCVSVVLWETLRRWHGK
mmetsp:Transcript_3560/g.7225  ORF Transcript_3560/g.7225 Transcript_3560/m.7225 type:complete len:454 (-) Transcript_3560:33-1394(-)